MAATPAGVSAAPRLRYLGLDARVALLEEEINQDRARRQLRCAERRRSVALRMQRNIDKLRRLRRPRDAQPLAQRVDLAAVIVATAQA